VGSSRKRLLITGASGQLGAYLLRELGREGRDAVAWSGSSRGERFGYDLRPVGLADDAALKSAFAEAKPDVVIHAGAIASIAACHAEPERARRVNVHGTEMLTDLAGRAGARLVFVSTDLVFDGERGGYREGDAPAPLSIYGRTKADAEAAVLAQPHGVVARVSLMFGPSLSGRASFFDQQVAALRAGKPVTLFEDEWRTPLSLSTAAAALVALADSDFTGLLHVGGPDRLSRVEMGRHLAAHLGADPAVIVVSTRAASPAPEPRPRDASLDSSRWRSLFPTMPWPAFGEALSSRFITPPTPLERRNESASFIRNRR
jgi:dTDP-4-dehydrorhamnose reductase